MKSSTRTIPSSASAMDRALRSSRIINYKGLVQQAAAKLQGLKPGTSLAWVERNHTAGLLLIIARRPRGSGSSLSPADMCIYDAQTNTFPSMKRREISRIYMENTTAN